ncbi:hypothetical protein RintRC_3596 [Richelia intracellularis]|nr:hypothetical protein RintRC_3596 [Richelia intracellularis]
MLHLICEAKRRGKLVVAGGAYVTSVPNIAQSARVDFLILDEG